MGKRLTWILLLLVLLSAVVSARQIALDEARRAAVRLVAAERVRPQQRLTEGDFRLGRLEPVYHGDVQAGFLVHLRPQGFMIMADISEAAPQVFISYDGRFAELRGHPFMVMLLERLVADKAALNYLAGSPAARLFAVGGSAVDAAVLQRNESAWSRWLAEAPPAQAQAEPLPAGDVAPLVASRWNQSGPYWNYTPRVDGVATYTGCSATAMAQIMYFWKYPAAGQGSHSYSWNGQTLSADFNHAYYWDRMLTSYGSGYTAEQADAVARLMSDVGIAINMNYGTGGSGAVPNANDAFFTFFKYSGDEHFVSRSSYADWSAWTDVFKAQVDLGRPALLATFKTGSGHAVVIDGYRSTPSLQVHVNMGWGGAADNYYDLSNLYGYGSASDYAVVDIHPGAPPSLRLLSPNGGEYWTQGAARAITWTATNYSGTVRVVLYRNGVKLGDVAKNVSAVSGSFTWTVGQYIGGTAAAGSGYRLYLRSSDGTLIDPSDTWFSIVAPAQLQLTSPNGGENWTIGTPHAITWAPGSYSGTVRLILFRNGTKVGQIAASIPAAAGTYSWSAGSHAGGTAPAGSLYTIRILSTDGLQQDYGDAPFTLSN